MSKKDAVPRILFFDIESSNLKANQGYCFCISWKWSYEKRTKVIAIQDYKTFRKDPTNDKLLIEAFKPIFNSADIIVSWYGSRFDVPFIQTRALLNSQDPFAEIAHIDLWRICRFQLSFTSNRLETVSGSLPIDEKEIRHEKVKVHNWIWVRAAAGHLPSLNFLKHRCSEDVYLLEAAYKKLRSHVKNHPNLAAIKNPNAKPHELRSNCKVCGSGHIVSNGKKVMVTKITRVMKCQSCGHSFSIPWKSIEIK